MPSRDWGMKNFLYLHLGTYPKTTLSWHLCGRTRVRHKSIYISSSATLIIATQLRTRKCDKQHDIHLCQCQRVTVQHLTSMPPLLYIAKPLNVTHKVYISATHAQECVCHHPIYYACYQAMEWQPSAWQSCHVTLLIHRGTMHAPRNNHCVSMAFVVHTPLTN